MSTIKEYLEQAHKFERDAFISQNPDPFLVQQVSTNTTDPRNEYRSTLRFKVDHDKQEVRVMAIPPSPMDTVVPLKKSERNSFSSKVLVGRTETNDVVIPHLTVSKHHAFFKFDQDAKRHTVTDAGSTNGTLLNGQAIVVKESRYLTDGDQVSFGDVKFLYYTSGGLHDLMRSLSILR